MIIATVKTCPQRWPLYRALVKNFAQLKMPMPLRTFQTPESRHSPAVNSRLNARAALAHCDQHLPNDPFSWALFLEDDVLLHAELPHALDWLVQRGAEVGVDCWYLCNRKNGSRRQFQESGFVINDLGSHAQGSHALLIPKRHLKRMLATHWRGAADSAMFAALQGANTKIFQIVSPVLAEHRGEYSTFCPQQPQQLKVNHANPSNPD